MQSLQPGWSALLWFVAVLALIPVALWLLKRTPLGGAGQQLLGSARAVAVLPLGPQQKVVTVEVGQGDERLWLVLGVTPQGIRTLHAMTAQGPAPAAPTAPGGGYAPQAAFAQLLSRLRQDPGRDTPEGRP